MNPALIQHAVSVLLGETEMSPDEFVKGVPDLMARYEFTPTWGIGCYDVKRWENDCYYYIGEVWHDEENDLWMARKVSPCGKRFQKWFPSSSQAPERPTREQAAKDLWKLYSDALEAGRVSCST